MWLKESTVVHTNLSNRPNYDLYLPVHFIKLLVFISALCAVQIVCLS